MGRKDSFIQHFKKMKTYDELAIGALFLNIYAVYTVSNISNFQELLEPMANQEIFVIQASALMAFIYLIEYMGDGEESSNDLWSSSSSQNEGVIAVISGFMEEGFATKIVDAASIGAVFLGYSYLGENSSINTSLTEFSTNPEVIAMQVSVLMIANFGIVLVSDLMAKN